MTSSQPYSLTTPPETLCILRLSALGDITHVLPTLRTLQTHWPDTKITWIIGKTEYQLVKDITDVHFIIFDKSAGLRAYIDLRNRVSEHLNGRHFDVLLHMQLSIRASLASLFIPSNITLGFDKARAKDLQSVFCNQQITPASTHQHVLDSFLEFVRFFNLEPVMQWRLPVSETALRSISQHLPTDRRLFIINPCAVAKSRNWRNWTTEGYAAIADYVHDKLAMQVVLTGGNSKPEKDTAAEMVKLCEKAEPLNLIGKTSIDELVAIISRADIVLAPDTGPVHIASALEVKTIGLYAATNPQRAGPYNHQQYLVNKYPEALRQYHQQKVQDASWGKRIKTAECMKLITVDDVIQQIENITANN